MPFLRLAVIILFSVVRFSVSASINPNRRVQRRMLDEIDIELMTDLAEQSIKFVKCYEEPYEAEEAEELEELDESAAEIELEAELFDGFEGLDDVVEEEVDAEGVGEQRNRRRQHKTRERRLDQNEPARYSFVTFRMCFTSSCDDLCNYQYSEYTVGMQEYLEATLQYRMEVQEQYCEICNKCAELATTLQIPGEEEANSVQKCQDFDEGCYSTCQNIENMEENGYMDASQFVECQMIHDEDGEVYYARAMCDSSSSDPGRTKINIGVFADEGCSIPDNTKDAEDYLKDDRGFHMKLSHSLLRQTYAKDGCVASCVNDEEVVDNSMANGEEETTMVRPEINEVCEDLYHAALYHEIEDLPPIGESVNVVNTYLSNLAFYSVKFDRCFAKGEAMTSLFGQRRLDDEGPIGTKQSMVSFRFCIPPLLAMKARQPVMTRVTLNTEKMVVDMETYLYFTLPYRRELQEEYCTACVECANKSSSESGVQICNDIDNFRCSDECESLESMAETGTLDAADFVDCKVIHKEGDEVFYAGPICSSDGSRISIGVFLDNECTVPDNTKDIESSFQGKLSYHLLNTVFLDGSSFEGRTFTTHHCHVAHCWLKRNLFSDVSPEINEVCASLYYSSKPWMEYYHNEAENALFGDDAFSDDYVTIENEWVSPVNYKMRERNALEHFYVLAMGNAWENNNLWLSNEPVCNWYGVYCNDGGSVTSLELSNNSIQGFFGMNLQNLANLTLLDLSNNALVGELPEEIGELQQLKHLKLGNNRIAGFIPTSLFRLSCLETLELQGNQFAYFPMTEFTYSPLPNLTKFHIGSNNIAGTLPPRAFSGNPKLQYVNMSHNRFAGTITTSIMRQSFEFGGFEGPHVLDLAFNYFKGVVPDFDNDLLNIDVVGNMLEGIDPAACSREWNDGATREYGCDGIACPNGTSNSEGRRSSDENPCVPCNVSLYFGTVGCIERVHEWEESYDDDAYDDRIFGFGDDQVEEIIYQPTPPPNLVLLSSYLQVVSPTVLAKQGGYDHRVALFGQSTFHGKSSIVANIYYADSDLCDSNVDTSKGYPIRGLDEPFILMVDRGQCTFVTKVRNAQNVGALAAIIADNTCLCDAGDLCASSPNQDCELNWPIMADDGSGKDIAIPSFFMLKQDADAIKAQLRANNDVMIEMTAKQLSGRVDYELWMSITDEVSKAFLETLKQSAINLKGHAYFTPRLFIFDGIRSGCVDGYSGENMCYNLCTNNGRYCATDPDNDLDSGISGADVVKESLRWLCIWHQSSGIVGFDGVGIKWWDYVLYFLDHCAPGLFANEDCIRGAMNGANIDPEPITQCMDDYGGLDGNVMNKLLEEQLRGIQEQSITTVPTLQINETPVRGELNPANALNAICAGFTAGMAPRVCRSSAIEPNTSQSEQSGSVPGFISTPAQQNNQFLALMPSNNATSNATTSVEGPLLGQSPLNPSNNAILNLTQVPSSEPSLEPSSKPSNQAVPTFASTLPPTDFYTVDADENAGQHIVLLW
eukprot:CAMPEP_0172543042 /NCGR_PEP_ID=MMETSP1067-20121228/13528_1 /TAXON_ID=265564 ORGANISM="Thalassiosira punctigera, Strain Tpunct2005C2" /NCGR_SAMPLE_ID=MMETSP1067 /ASSEMBLY_ACC=CAM_ASM_000444 /LENGTH=1502 /DNA_ID=CAMNT_0013329371 /DNA_START=170 /DNA_END=4676 /DNA_ORIENTATION=-